MTSSVRAEGDGSSKALRRGVIGTLIDADGMPVLIHFDGAHFFDVELEHAFMDFGFAEHILRSRKHE